jgi:hypothetical protein
MHRKGKMLIVGGMAQLPKELSNGEVFQVIVAVENDTGKVVEVEIIPTSQLILEMLKSILVGMSLRKDVYDLLQKIELRLFHRSKKAVIVAVQDMVWEYRQSQPPKTFIPS